MKRLIVVLCLMFSMVPVFAGRVFPNYLQFVQLREVNLRAGQVKVIDARSGFVTRMYKKPVTYKLSAAVRIRDEGNRFVVRNRLNGYSGRLVGIRLMNGSVNEIWVLSEEEIGQLKERIKGQ